MSGYFFVGTGNMFGGGTTPSGGGATGTSLFVHPPQAAGPILPAVYDGAFKAFFADNGSGQIRSTEPYGLGCHVAAPMNEANLKVCVDVNMAAGAEASVYARSTSSAQRFGGAAPIDDFGNYAAGVSAAGDVWLKLGNAVLWSSSGNTFTGVVKLTLACVGSQITASVIDNATGLPIETSTVTDTTIPGSTAATSYIGFATVGGDTNRYVENFKAFTA